MSTTHLLVLSLWAVVFTSLSIAEHNHKQQILVDPFAFEKDQWQQEHDLQIETFPNTVKEAPIVVSLSRTDSYALLTRPLLKTPLSQKKHRPNHKPSYRLSATSAPAPAPRYKKEHEMHIGKHKPTEAENRKHKHKPASYPPSEVPAPTHKHKKKPYPKHKRSKHSRGAPSPY